MIIMSKIIKTKSKNLLKTLINKIDFDYIIYKNIIL